MVRLSLWCIFLLELHGGSLSLDGGANDEGTFVCVALGYDSVEDVAVDETHEAAGDWGLA